MKREHIFSPDRVYRYTLWREWGSDLFMPLAGKLVVKEASTKSFVQFIGLNPSTADELKDDPTIRRVKDFARRWGFGAVCMTNIYAFRSPDPMFMREHEAPIGDQNDGWLNAVADAANLTVCCWGAHGRHNSRGASVADMLRKRGVKLYYLRLLADGVPEHPLYLPKLLEPTPWP